jgi:phage-related protein
MPPTNVYFYREASGEAPVIDWLLQLRRRDRRAAVACYGRLKMLRQFGHELRRPAADFLRDGIYELRVKRGHVNYRILYFFHGNDIAIAAHDLVKERTVPVADIERALKRKAEYERNPKEHRSIDPMPEDEADL